MQLELLLSGLRLCWGPLSKQRASAPLPPPCARDAARHVADTCGELQSIVMGDTPVAVKDQAGQTSGLLPDLHPLRFLQTGCPSAR
jgi:hypothetical protein